MDLCCLVVELHHLQMLLPLEHCQSMARSNLNRHCYCHHQKLHWNQEDDLHHHRCFRAREDYSLRSTAQTPWLASDEFCAVALAIPLGAPSSLVALAQLAIPHPILVEDPTQRQLPLECQLPLKLQFSPQNNLYKSQTIL